MLKILISDKLAKEGIELLKNMEGVEPVIKTGLSEDDLIKIIGEFDGLIIRSDTKVTAKVLGHCTKLRGIARAGVGIDNVDVKEATKRGIIVMNTPGGNTLSAAEHTMALMLAISRKVVPACVSLKSGNWDRKSFTGNQLNHKVLGLIGLGRIGQAVAKMALGFDMKVLGYDPLATPKAAEELGIEVTDNLERIFRESDYISLHVPKNEQTVNMIAAPQLKMMKPTAILVNCARGGVINEDALYDALQANTIAGAALDVFSKEPPENMRFKDLANCLVTPHLGASTQEAQIEVAVEAAQILVDALKGGPIRNAVNAPSMASLPPLVSQYAELARRIGTVLATITHGRVKSVRVEYRGEIAAKPLAAVTTAFTIGLMQPHSDSPVNIVNAALLAKECGITIDEVKNPEAQDVASSFSATVSTDKVTRFVRGTIFGDKISRILEIDGFNVEVTPKGTLAVIFNDDKPGVIGHVGTIMGRHKINISTMGVGQKLDQGKAILAVSLDKAPGEAVLKELKDLDFVNEVYHCDLD